ncbi:MAG: alpha-mannosidase [Ardenticatenaceae bacterium]|nr:alpha-mannosidase [Ardenticatenaceae bacterium]
MKHKTRWTAKKIAQRLRLIEQLVYRQQYLIPPFRYTTLPGPEAEPLVGPAVDDSRWDTIAPHSYWGSWLTDFVLRTTFTVPEEWPADLPVALYLPLGDAGDFSHPEALLYVDGRSLAACDRHHQEIWLPDELRDGSSHQLALHGWTGRGDWMHREPHTQLFMRPCAVVQIDQPTRDFVAAVRVALGIADQLDDNEPAKGYLYTALDKAFCLLDTREPYGRFFYDSIAEAHDSLQNDIAQAGRPLDVTVTASGHAHIDIAWLWTVAQARRKAGRTFHTVLHLMQQFPNYHFTQSQPQLYDYIRQDYPDLFEGIKQRVADGRWEPIGGMWVEADCTLSGGEALARQFLLGRTFFREQFGPQAESPVLWLPDVFGYAWNLPQLIKEAGLEYFFTIKISWSQYNRMPYDSFWWQGLNGTQVLTHFSTTQDAGSFARSGPSTYNSMATPLEVISTWQNLQQKESQQQMLMSYGFGDGGGGPTREMLENIREMGDFPGTPRVKYGRAIDFFRQLEAESGDDLPTWNGELYLEYHRGTYTTQARTKRNNRKSEFLLHDAEFLAAWAALATDFTYPHADLTCAWQLLCLNQFHDILPGSSINQVYKDSENDHVAIRALGEPIRDAALAALGQMLPETAEFIVANPTAFGGARLALLPETLAEGQTVRDAASGEILATQPTTDGTLVALPHIAGHGLLGLAVAEAPQPALDGMLAVEVGEDTAVLENDLLRVEFAPSGDIVTLTDKENGRAVLPTGVRANVFQAFEDRPLNWDAWDIDIFYDEKVWTAEPAHSVTVIESGPLRVGLEVRRRLLHSDIVQRVTLARGERRLDFDTTVEWRERHVMLKVAFPVDVLSPTATFDVQWGNVQRNTHRNTSWDWARFESCAHKWIDLSEGNYGVSLLNDCKYGHDVQDNVLRLTLLRSPTFPDPEADQGTQQFTYSLLPHPGDWRGKTAAAAYALNDPLIVQRVASGGGPGVRALVSVDAPNVVVETIKQAEDGNGLIVRLYENERCRGPVTLRTSFPLTAAYRCNLLEETQETLVATENETTFTITPYQIVTLRLVAA